MNKDVLVGLCLHIVVGHKDKIIQIMKEIGNPMTLENPLDSICYCRKKFGSGSKVKGEGSIYVNSVSPFYC